MNEQYERFRAALPIVFFGLLAFGTAIAAIAVTALGIAGYPVPGIRSATFLWILNLLWIWLLVCTPVVAWNYTIHVEARGVTGRTFWGRKRFLAWEDMNRVKRLGVYPFLFLRIRTNAGGPPMWIPLFLSKRGAWAREVQTRVPDGHPLRDFI